MSDFHVIADSVAAEIAAGTLPPGTRLPPQRTFADQRGIAASTASRVYAELTRRGLVLGEVGRGTFVRAPEVLRAIRINEAADAPIDMQLAISSSLDQAALMAPAFQSLAGPVALWDTLSALGPFGPKGAGETVARFLACKGWKPDPAGIMFAGGGRQAIACALAALCKPGDRVGVEPLTYPSIIRMAARLGIQLVPIDVDHEGIDPAALAKAHGAKPLAAIYVQPSIHNPLGISMTLGRRLALSRMLDETGLLCIEDGAFAFLSDMAPLVSFAPDRVIYVNSMQKRLGPGVGVGFVVAPPQVKDDIAAIMRAGGWMASSLSMHMVLSWIADGTAGAVTDLKRLDARARQTLAAKILGIQPGPGKTDAFHLWLTLPPAWNPDAFTAAAALQGVAITSAGAFAVASGQAPNAVRLALSSPSMMNLEQGLQIIRTLLTQTPGDALIE
ncbi:PLP-dependent aminotransferase family protein [Achromobacter pestifer]|uniref:Vitamin B6 salvage pathway transcriptional repressor PtsJ n=1 Tax=Achromobacter pestifer TaxID=1353889 RepID=A0A6S6YL81_9BURK|nr:PLP-dependent aminotransferase family protein [Achromobacter pestifer]CAB3627670.1 Vitamin B6 salvage pathway transcriptional repressor PtsJ [Achromobacter pestifer]